MFAKQREEMKAAGKLDGLREKLQAISKKYSGAFRLPPYFTLILRAFGTLEGLGLKTNENFAIVKECFPYIARRLITDDSFRMREALRSYLYKGRSRIAVSRIDELATGFGNFTNLMNAFGSWVRKGSRTESAAAGGIQIEQNGQNGTHEQSNGQSNGRVREVDSATREIAEVVFSPDGNFLQDLLIEEGVAAIDALSRASLVRLLRTLGPLALPLALPLNFLLGGADDQQLLSREDKQSLLVLRRITELVDAGRRPAAESDEAADFGETVRSLQRLQPIAQGLLPSITPGAASFAGRFARQLARRVLLRLADDVERRANNAWAWKGFHGLQGICDFYEDASMLSGMFSGVKGTSAKDPLLGEGISDKAPSLTLSPRHGRHAVLSRFSDFADQVGLSKEPGSNTLLWLIVQHMVELPLPPHWSMEEGYKGQFYFFNGVAGETSAAESGSAVAVRDMDYSCMPCKDAEEGEEALAAAPALGKRVPDILGVSLEAFDVVLGGAVLKGTVELGRLRQTVEELTRRHLLSDPRDATSAIRASGRRSLWPWALSLLRDLALRHLEPSIIACSAAMRACESGGWLQTLQLLRCGREGELALDVVACGTVMSSSLKREEPWPLSIAFIAEMEQTGSGQSRGRGLPRPDVACYTATMDACTSWSGALGILGQVRARQLEVDPVLLSSAHSCCARADQWHYVLSATEARRPGRRGFAGNILGNALGQAGRWEAGCSWLSEAQKGQLKPDVVTYSGLFCDWSQSLRLLATMQTHGIRCNVVALTRAVATLSDRWQASLAVVSQLWEGRLASDEGLARSLLASCRGGSELVLGLLRGFQALRVASAEVLGAAVQSLARQARWQLAAKLAEPLLAGFSSLILIRREDAADVLWLWIQVDWALSWLPALRQRRAMPDERVRPDPFSLGLQNGEMFQVAALSVCGRGGQWWRALGLLCFGWANDGSQDMAELRVPAGRFATAASLGAMESARRWRSSLSLLRGVVRKDRTALSVPAVNAAAAACEKGWRWEEAASLLGWMRAAGREPDLISCNSLRSACAAAALWQRALAPGARDVVSFTTMVDALPAAHWQGAVQLFADMAEQAVQPNELFLGAFGGFPTSWPLALQLLEGRAPSLVVLVKVLNAAGQTQVAFRDQTSQLLQNLLRHNLDGHDFSQPLAAAEALMAFTGALQPEVLASLQSQIYWPALLQLRGLTLRPSRGGDGAFISDRVLERRFNLGPLTSAAMEQLGLEHTAPARWSAVARRSCRQGEHEGEGEGGLNGLKPEPSAQAVLAWSSVALGSALRRRGVVTKPGPGASFFGTFGPDREDLRRLKPVFADHDRSGHAERIALLTVLTSLKLRPGAS
ncbi:unnamed protein product [Symbiodinium microadriaticum]|nr:unnamed protein product [Symbiodinium microadriaticum]